ncbi:MAG TPA: hypothetical protein DCE41_37055 [Cytophagales bacterium]|nr:hypothetical protein [Cytophagales bacterium]HAA21181.1 hypothetical protein [Cytophagales bacterium]HAP60701.1 hypothetical protein [Cytophagales bacterium]
MKEYSNHRDSFAQAWQEAFEGAEQAPGPQVWDNIHQSLAGGATASAMANIFDEAEVAPSADVWDKVESTLAQDEAVLYKRKMRRYQYVAAAAIALLLLLGGRDLYKGTFENTSTLADVGDKPTEADFFNPQESYRSLASTVSSHKDPSGKGLCEGSFTAPNTIMDEVGVPTLMASLDGGNEEISRLEENTILGSGESRLPQTMAFEPKMVLVSSEEDIERSALLLNPLSRTEPVMAQHSQPMEERMIYLDPSYVKRPGRNTSVSRSSTPSGPFASLAMNGGSFNPNYQNLLNSGPELTQSFGFVADGTSEAVESLEQNMSGAGSISAGVQVGIPVAQRWMLYTGAGIGNYQVKGESEISFSLQIPGSNAALPTTASTYQMVRESFNNQNDQSEVDPYQVTENFQFVSVPVQMGYLALDKKVQVWLLGGVSADVFLRNTVVSEIFSHENLIVNANDPSSPYQPVVVSGVIGTDVSYQLSDHWSVSVQPTVRQAINSIAKDGEVFSGTPSFFDLGFRLKYHVQ